MHNGFNRQNTNFFTNQIGNMNRFQAPQNNMNRMGMMFQNQGGQGFVRPQNVGGPVTNFARPPVSVNNSTNGGTGVQSRLGPRTPITAPGKNEPPATAGRPVLRRPGSMDKDKALKPEDKTQTADEKNIATGNKPEIVRGAVSSATPGSKNDSKPSPAATPNKSAAKDTPVDDLPQATAPSKFGGSPAVRNFPAASQPPQGKADAAKQDSEEGPATTRFGPGKATGPSSVNSPNRFGVNVNSSPNKSGTGPGEIKHEQTQERGPNNVSEQIQARGPNNTPDQTRGANNAPERYTPTTSGPGGNASQHSRPYEPKTGNQGDQSFNRNAGPNLGRPPPNNRNLNEGSNNRNQGNNDRNQGNMDRNQGNMDRNQGNMDRNQGNMDRNQGKNDRNQGRFDHGSDQQDGRFGQPQRASRFNANHNVSNTGDSNQQDRNKSGDGAANRVGQGPGSHGGGSSQWSSSGPPSSGAAASAASKDAASRRAAPDMNRSRGGFSQEKFWERLQELSGPQYDLEPLDMAEKKFNAQSCLFVGSLPRDCTLEELKEMFGKYGELGQVYFNKDGAYAFINFDYHVNAEKAMREYNGSQIRGRSIKVRFAAIKTGVRVKNLTINVSNELLYKAFSVFGSVEQSRVIVDDRGKPTGDGIVIFTERKSANMAYKKCQEESFFLTNQLRPVIVEPWENRDEEEGYPESGLVKNEQYKKDRKVGPRFAEPNSIESEYGKQWKQLFDLYKEKRQSLEADLKAEMDALEVKMQLVVHQQETEKLRKELAQREQEALQLQMGLGNFRDSNRPSQLSTDEFGGGYGKRPQDYYDAPVDHRSPYETSRQYDDYYPQQRGGYDRPDDRAAGYGRGQTGYDARPAGYDGRSQGYDGRGANYDARTQGYEARSGGRYDATNQGYGYESASAGSPYETASQKTGNQAQLPPSAAAAAAGGPAAAGYDMPTGAAASTGGPAANSIGDVADSYAASAGGYSRSSNAAAAAGSAGYGRSSAAGGASSSGGYGRSTAGSAGGYERAPTASGQGYDVGQQGTSPYESSSKRSRY